jgi:hypothetical protein
MKIKIMIIMMVMMMIMMMMIMTIVSAEQRPGWGEHVPNHQPGIRCISMLFFNQKVGLPHTMARAGSGGNLTNRHTKLAKLSHLYRGGRVGYDDSHVHLQTSFNFIAN